MPIVSLLNTRKWSKGKTYIDFEYDFRNKTMAQLTTDWWIERTSWSTQISSEWIKATSFQYMYNYLPDLQQALQDANIITMKTWHYNWWTSAWYYCDAWVWVWEDSYKADGARLAINYNSIRGSANAHISNLINYTFSAWNMPVWNYESTIVINKQTKQLSVTVWTYYTNTISIPDEQLSSIDTYNLFTVIYWQSAYTRKVSIKTE